jgi:hypothetical protein
MKHTADSKKWKRTDTCLDNGDGPSVWLLPAGGQFYTRSCTRCARLLPNARSYDLEDDRNSGEDMRCIHCGDLIDSIILSNENMPVGT